MLKNRLNNPTGSAKLQIIRESNPSIKIENSPNKNNKNSEPHAEQKEIPE
jgi:hypothetical protein